MDHTVVGSAEGSGTVMAFETYGEDRGPLQHLRVGRAVRHVAGFASVDAHRGVLVNKRAALVGMALEARLFVAFLLIDHARAGSHSPGGCERAMRIVAIRTFDHA